MLYALNRPGTIHYTTRNEDGEAVTPGAAPTIAITNTDAESVASGTMTLNNGHGNHHYDYALPSAVRGTLGVYDVSVTYTLSGTSYTDTFSIEIVGAFLFEVDEIRDVYPELNSAARYTLDMVRAARDEATARLENAANVAFATRRTVQTVSGDDTTTLVLPHTDVQAVSYISVDGDVLTAEELADLTLLPQGIIKRSDGTAWSHGVHNIVVEYDHGYELPPGPVRRAAMRLAVDALVPSGLPSRAMSQSTDLGEIRFSLANPEAGRPTGDPEVDAVIALFGRNGPRIG